MKHTMTMTLFQGDPDGGTEIEIGYTTADADFAVGIESAYVEEWWIAGKGEKIEALQKRLSDDTAEDERVGEYLNEQHDFYDDEPEYDY